MDKPEDDARGGSEQVTELTISHVDVIPEYQRQTCIVFSIPRVLSRV
jgi:hypothetical protein